MGIFGHTETLLPPNIVVSDAFFAKYLPRHVTIRRRKGRGVKCLMEISTQRRCHNYIFRSVVWQINFLRKFYPREAKESVYIQGLTRSPSPTSESLMMTQKRETEVVLHKMTPLGHDWEMGGFDLGVNHFCKVRKIQEVAEYRMLTISV